MGGSRRPDDPLPGHRLRRPGRSGAFFRLSGRSQPAKSRPSRYAGSGAAGGQIHPHVLCRGGASGGRDLCQRRTARHRKSAAKGEMKPKDYLFLIVRVLAGGALVYAGFLKAAAPAAEFAGAIEAYKVVPAAWATPL